MSDNLKLIPALVQKVENLTSLTSQLIEAQQAGFYSVQEFSKLSGLKQDTITQLCTDEALAATKIPGSAKWMILKSELNRLVKRAINNNSDKLRRTSRTDAAILKHVGLL